MDADRCCHHVIGQIGKEGLQQQGTALGGASAQIVRNRAMPLRAGSSRKVRASSMARISGSSSGGGDAESPWRVTDIMCFLWRKHRDVERNMRHGRSRPTEPPRRVSPRVRHHLRADRHDDFLPTNPGPIQPSGCDGLRTGPVCPRREHESVSHSAKMAYDQFGRGIY